MCFWTGQTPFITIILFASYYFACDALLLVERIKYAGIMFIEKMFTGINGNHLVNIPVWLDFTYLYCLRRLKLSSLTVSLWFHLLWQMLSFCLFVCLYVCHTRAPCLSRWTEWDAIWQGLSWSQVSLYWSGAPVPHRKGRFEGWNPQFAAMPPIAKLLWPLFLCLQQCGIMYLGCLCVCVCLTVCLCVPNIVSTISWKALDILDTKLSALMHFGTRWMLDSKDQSSRPWLVQLAEKCTFCLFSTIPWKLVDWISPNFQRWCILVQGWMRLFGVKRSKVKVTAWPRVQWAEAYRVQHCALGCNF